MTYPSPYLEFIRLFNERHFFEAHEVLELFWREEKGPDRDFYQGLIQLAALFVHLEKGNRAGAERLFQTASGYLRPYGESYQGLPLGKLLPEINQIIAKHSFDLTQTPVLPCPSEQP